MVDRNNTLEKSALLVQITGTTLKQGVTYYTVEISKGYQKSDKRTVLRRYSAFEALYEELQSLGIKLPALPIKFHLIHT